MLSTRDVMAVVSQLRDGIEGLGGATHVVSDERVRKSIGALREQLAAVLDNVESAARKSGIVPRATIQPRPTVPERLASGKSPA